MELASGGDGWTSGAKTAEPVVTPSAPPGALVSVLTVSTWGAGPREEVVSVDQEKPGTRKPGSGCFEPFSRGGRAGSSMYKGPEVQRAGALGRTEAVPGTGVTSCLSSLHPDGPLRVTPSVLTAQSRKD